MTAINGSCKHREQLWERWIDACSELAEVSEAERTKEQGIRHLLNDHMKKHDAASPCRNRRRMRKSWRCLLKILGLMRPVQNHLLIGR